MCAPTQEIRKVVVALVLAHVAEWAQMLWVPDSETKCWPIFSLQVRLKYRNENPFKVERAPLFGSCAYLMVMQVRDAYDQVAPVSEVLFGSLGSNCL